MFNKIIKSTLILVLAFGFQAKAVLVNARIVKHQSKHTIVKPATQKEPGSSIDVLSIPGSAAQLTPQIFKTPTFIKYTLMVSYQLAQSINYLKHIPSSSSIRLASFYQLILYPFHAFW